MSQELLDDTFSKIKKEMLMAFTKYSLSGEAQENQDAVVSSILFSLFNVIETPEQFYEKYQEFKKLSRFIQNSYLFDLIDIISKGENENQIDRAIRIYQDLIKNEDFKKVSDSFGYRLTEEFAERDNYLNNTLKDKVSFYHVFESKLDGIYQELSTKGAFRR